MHLYDTSSSKKKELYTDVVIALAIVALAIGLVWGIGLVSKTAIDASSPRELRVQLSGKPMPNVMDIPIVPGATNIDKSMTADSFDVPVYHLSYDTAQNISEVSAYYEDQLTKRNWGSYKAAGSYSDISDPIFGQRYWADALTSPPSQLPVSYGVAVKAITTGGITHVQINYGRGYLLFTK